jgi:hypothetical protein
VQVQERNVEGATAEIVDRDLGLGDDGEPAVSQGRGGGLVDNALDVEAGDAPGVLGGLALATASMTGSPRYSSAIRFILSRM